MIELRESVCVEAPAADVWASLARLEDIQLWSEAVVSARCDGPRPQGVGAERTCELAGGMRITERWTRWEDGRSFSYEGSGLPLVARAENTWSICAQGARTLVTTQARLELKGGIFGRALEPLAALQAKRMAPRTLAALKYLIEHGKPAPVKHSRLPRAPAAC